MKSIDRLFFETNKSKRVQFPDEEHVKKMEDKLDLASKEP